MRELGALAAEWDEAWRANANESVMYVQPHRVKEVVDALRAAASFDTSTFDRVVAERDRAKLALAKADDEIANLRRTVEAESNLRVVETITCEFGCGPTDGEQYVGGSPGYEIVPACPVHGWVTTLLDDRDDEIGRLKYALLTRATCEHGCGPNGIAPACPVHGWMAEWDETQAARFGEEVTGLASAVSNANVKVAEAAAILTDAIQGHYPERRLDPDAWQPDPSTFDVPVVYGNVELHPPITDEEAAATRATLTDVYNRGTQMISKLAEINPDSPDWEPERDNWKAASDGWQQRFDQERNRTATLETAITDLLDEIEEHRPLLTVQAGLAIDDARRIITPPR